MPHPSVPKKLQERSNLIERARDPVKQNVSDKLTGEIISATIQELVAGIKEKRWTATQTVSAYIAQAIKAHDATNCLTEVLFDSAFKRAKELDEEFTKTGELCGPLHGVPLTFKDQYKIEGFDNTIGFTHWIDQHATQDAELVAQARAMGGIPIAKTNVPQTMMSFECVNPLWGRSTNPYSADHTCGGSSGGEAAVLRFSGSALGMGSDIGGSLRLKPTDGRFSGRGAVGCVPGFMGVTTVYGPMARSVADVKYACEIFFGRPAITPSATLPPVKYRTDLDFSKPFKIGYFKSDRFVRASPACQRAVHESVKALEKEGHSCVEISPPDVVEMLKLFVELTSADGYQTMMSHLQSDQQEPALFLVTLGPRLPAFVRAITNLLVNTFIHDSTFAYLFGASRPRSVAELWEASAKRLAADSTLQNHFWSQSAGALGLDAIICPVQALPGLPHGATKTLTPLAAGTIAWNVIECPVGVVPVTRVDSKLDALTNDWLGQEYEGPVLYPSPEKVVKERTTSPSYMMERAVYGSGKRLLQPLDDPVPVYDAEKMEGLPVGVQIVGRPWEDEKVVHIMEALDKALGERDFMPTAGEEWKMA
ncbi:Fatty acid amide hydrolase 1 [Ceratobasidium theobromae]|uniref:Fatty acid amide hydrolase 1 n=1 Tax=Ceratobasidium theobromae TaxID=1582974 RepID=A0A5N5QSS8_9AGAM|nr:Fatty acid amide hydrolase 1 [Ceratobasidium theobromae]